jgi:hydroxyacylglutathione hydrolase
MLHITPIPSRKDNYIWMVSSTDGNQCIIVDPGESRQVMDTLSLHQLTLSAILVTHHHYDHTDGIDALLEHYDVPVYGPAHDNINNLTQPLEQDDNINIKALNLDFEVLFIPGHTLGHIAYYCKQGFVFTGDTLFTGSCGRLFEGTAQQMYDSLSKLAALPDETLIYCGHEYTQGSLAFAQHIEPDNRALLARIQETDRLRKHGIPTVPASLSLEKQTNPFLRCNQQAVIKAAEAFSGKKLTEPWEVFASIRRQKDGF